jgi:DNA primase
LRSLHHNAQRLLKPVKVVNPYAEHLTFMDDKTRTRRDHRKYLGLIRAITLLHQYQRPTRSLVREGSEPVTYIEATLDDIAAANSLAHAVLGTTLDELPPQTRALLKLVRAYVETRATAESTQPRDVRFTRRDVRTETAWGDTQLKLHLHRLESLEYLLVRREGARFVYELVWAGEGMAEGEEADTPFVMGLIDVAALRSQTNGGQSLHTHGYDDDRAGVNPNQSPLGRGAVGPVSPPCRNPESGETPSALRLAAITSAPPPKRTLQGTPESTRSYAHAAGA